MKTFIKCEMCNAEVPADRCVFATRVKVVDGKEHIYCCIKVQKKHEKR
jgi:hypothetical protein